MLAINGRRRDQGVYSCGVQGRCGEVKEVEEIKE
jgi:hypothetical protein